MDRGYQLGFSENADEMFDASGRQRKAETMIAVLKDHSQQNLKTLSLLNIGGSAGIIDEYLSRYFARVVGIDIDKNAIEHAKDNYKKENLTFEIGDAMDLHYPADTFDIAVCSQVYEHVPNAKTLISEIYRVLKPGGVCYFAAGNRLMLNEPHYNLPMLSMLPRPLSHIYLKLSGKGSYYYEKHLSYWGLKRLVNEFEIHDYTKSIILNPKKYAAEYMLERGGKKHKVASFLAKYAFWAIPGYIWVLQKPKKMNAL